MLEGAYAHCLAFGANVLTSFHERRDKVSPHSIKIENCRYYKSSNAKPIDGYTRQTYRLTNKSVAAIVARVDVERGQVVQAALKRRC